MNDDFEWLCMNKYYNSDCLSAWDVDFNVEPSEKAEGNVEELEECSMALVNYSMCNREIRNNSGNVKNLSLWIYMTKKVGKKWHFLGYFRVS